MITATGFLLYYIFRTTRDPIQRPGLLFNLNNGYPTHSVVGSIVYQPSAFRSIIRWSALFHEKRCKILIPHETRGLAWTCCAKLFCRLYLLLTWLLFICLSMVCAWAAVFRIPCKTMSSLYCDWWRVSSKHKWLSWFNGVKWLMMRLLHYDLNKLKKTYFHRTKTWNTANELYILKFSSFFLVETNLFLTIFCHIQVNWIFNVRGRVRAFLWSQSAEDLHVVIFVLLLSIDTARYQSDILCRFWSLIRIHVGWFCFIFSVML